MREASKTKATWTEFEFSLLSGKGIDIGCGKDPIIETVRKFDILDGDANNISQNINEQFDFVFSAHCLEHMIDPAFSLKQWWQLVKPNGHLILIVPDEDLYEQGYFPSIFNSDHKATFTISKQKSWSPKSYNMIDLINSLDNSQLLSIHLQDVNYDKRLLNLSVYSHRIAYVSFVFHRKIITLLESFGIKTNLSFLPLIFRYPVDQTLGDAMAQIQCIVKKKS